MDGAQTFELSVPGWRVRGARTAWYAGIGFSVFLAILSLLALYATVRDFMHRGGPIPAWVALAICVIFFWGFLTVLFTTVYNFRPSGPTRLTVSSSGLELYYPPGRIRFSRQWSDPELRLVLRDFRGYPGPADQDLVLDTGDHRLIAWLLPSRVPPSAYLTPPAYDAILSEVARNHLAVTRRDGSNVAWLYKNEEIRISHVPG